MEISRVNFSHLVRPNQEQLRKMQLYRPSGRNQTRGLVIPVDQRSIELSCSTCAVPLLCDTTKTLMKSIRFGMSWYMVDVSTFQGTLRGRTVKIKLTELYSTY